MYYNSRKLKHYVKNLSFIIKLYIEKAVDKTVDISHTFCAHQFMQDGRRSPDFSQSPISFK